MMLYLSLRFKCAFSLFFALVLSLGISLPTWAAEDPLYPQGKRAGFMGDPSHKRGLELGFDLGLKAGARDKLKQEKSDLRVQNDFQNPEKHYRYEYGSRSAFISGFLGGFAGGYRQGYTQGMSGFQPPSSSAAAVHVVDASGATLPMRLPTGVSGVGENFSLATSSAQLEEVIKKVKNTRKAPAKSNLTSPKRSEESLRLDAM